MNFVKISYLKRDIDSYDMTIYMVGKWHIICKVQSGDIM